MGWIEPELPDVDVAVWSRGTRAEKIRPMAQHWACVGFGTPVVLHLFYVLKIALYTAGGAAIVAATTGLDGWAEPIAFEKVVLYTMLFEVVGLGCGFGPLNNRYLPPLGSILYWLRPGTIRLPPWPGRAPLTRGSTRTPVDAALYGALLAAIAWALCSNPLPRWQVGVVLGVLVLLSLRDKTIFLAARGEVYATLAMTYLFAGNDPVIAAKVVFLVIWLGAAVSKFNRHFPFVVSTMMSNNPLVRPRRLKQAFFERFPDDLRPGRPARVVAHTATAVELCVPVMLFSTHGGAPTAVAAGLMIAFHGAILAAVPMGVPLEWNVFMIYGVAALFGAHAELGLADLDDPMPVAALFAVVAGTVVAGNLFPRKVSFLPGMRYYAGNWDTGLWCVTSSAAAKIAENVVAVAAMPAAQLQKFYGDRTPILIYLGYAFRAMNSHGRALFTLAHRAMPAGKQDDYAITDGERMCSTALGWNFGDGHLHNEQLIAALQQRCSFEPGEVRVILLDAQPIHRQTQQYRLVDAATGEFERGYVRVADMVTRQPWDDELPVHVT
ncbi:MAG: DUF3556 family protein [Mycobacteriaceae bacterium]|nr:DUF3556 family protein [Mycobacteriaceae bacterium]